MWTLTSNDSCIWRTKFLLLLVFNFTNTINEPSASTNPVTQLPVKLQFLLSEYDLVYKTELKDNPLFFLVVNTFCIFIITTIIINKTISIKIHWFK